MAEDANRAKSHPTPSRRRQGRNHGKASAQKMYASENDASTPSAVSYGQVPTTPQKATSTSASPGPPSAAPTSTASKPSRPRNNKSSGKPRPRHVAGSPESTRAAHVTPPSGAPVAKTTSATAFAGSTFHASPAPSALPIPSFLSKSAGTSSAAQEEARAVPPQQPSPPATDSEMPTPQRPSGFTIHESPLEAMFRADRAEKERARRTSFVNPATGRQEFMSPPNPSPREPHTMPQTQGYMSRERPQPQRSTSGIPLSELDGTPGGPLGPAFSTPYHERIRAARESPQSITSQGANRSPVREDPSEALKKVLFGSSFQKPDQAPSGPSAAPATAPANVPTPTYQTHTARNDPSVNRPSGLAAMEDDLRRILKLS